MSVLPRKERQRRILFLTLVAFVIFAFLLQTPLFVPTWYVTLVLFVVSCLGIIFMMHLWRVEVVQEVTGLDSEKARRILRASWTMDWSQVPDEDLKLREISQEEDVKRKFDPYRRFERMVVTAICIEQAKRKTRSHGQSQRMASDQARGSNIYLDGLYAKLERIFDEDFPPTQEDQRKTDLVLNEHRQLRSSKGISADTHVWTRSNDGCLITEYRNYWAEVGKAGDKFGFVVHEKGKKFGYDIVCSSFECVTEADAKQGAVAYMLHGKKPS
jgi:hypothetical protein